MSKHVKEDIGLKHVKKLQLHPFNNQQEMIKEYGKRFGKEKEKEIIDLYSIGYENPEFYVKKNSDYNLAMFLSGAYDADIVHKVCNWIYNNKENFGDSILEIGCDCGFITTFLGSQFPDKKITSIDCNPNAITIAKKNCEKFGIENVKFECCSIEDIQGRKFDTVLSVRVMQMNEKGDGEDVTLELIPYAEYFTNNLSDYAESLSNVVEDDGNIISIERIERNALMLGWIAALTYAGIEPDYKETITVKEMDQKNTLTAFICKKNDKELYPFGIFAGIVGKQINTQLSNYKDWDAKIMFELTKGEKVMDYLIYNGATEIKSHFALYRHKRDETCVLVYQNHNGNASLIYIDVSELEFYKSQLQNTLREAEMISCDIQEF